jgi:predicted small lipoprotein YifL
MKTTTKCALLALAALTLTGCGASQGPYRPPLGLPSTPQPEPTTIIEGALPGSARDARRAAVPDSVMIREDGFGN